jgi:hypothetical protein
MEINSKVYFAADEAKTSFEKIMEMDKENFHLSILFPSFLSHSFQMG